MGDASEDIDVETEEYVYDLVQISPDEDEIIAVISEGRWYQIFLMASTTRLSKEEKLLILDEGCVDWAGLSADVLMAITDHVPCDHSEKCRPAFENADGRQAIYFRLLPEELLSGDSQQMPCENGLLAICSPCPCNWILSPSRGRISPQ